MHLRDFVNASQKLKATFKKLLAIYRQWKEKKEYEKMFRLVNEFD
jgi:hypothetical protein